MSTSVTVAEAATLTGKSRDGIANIFESRAPATRVDVRNPRNGRNRPGARPTRMRSQCEPS